MESQTAVLTHQATTVSSAQPHYMVQLDALRAVAVLSVMYFHFYQDGRQGVVPWGEWGVQLFFVLSGFLITGILLNCRDLSDPRSSKLHQLKQFYIRRSLRIVPLFYFVLLLAAALNIYPVRETLLWHLAYLSNVYFSVVGTWEGVGPISHLWSLAVEEQFYLVWPWLILFLPRLLTLPAILAAIAIAPTYRVYGYVYGLNPIALGVMTIGCLDALGLGALMALYRHHYPRQFIQVPKHALFNLLGVAMVAALTWSLATGSSELYSGVPFDLLALAVFAWLIYKAAIGFGGAAGRVVEWKPLLYLGKISYGLYVYHNFMPIVVPGIYRRLNMPYPTEQGVKLMLLSAVTIVVASLSWFFLERPINNLKRRFEYSRDRQPVTP